MTALQPEITALVARQREQRLADGIAAEARHQMDPAEGPVEAAFYRLCCNHPDTCSCDRDYPDWTPGGAQ
ncbi:hypothetical protein EASAB2608_06265 [Streptomyces sp. EAS-AB2608]|uniref:hypothetical protein n=1 Tax=Streptomyces sp. EAS-AB2608 TaxID=2779671 RepID=UPI001BED6D0B|nr:hypothetical protein [Streptomyces sp. EAS-AB2608]BCM70931.1 hypothetical protein EASAB2608_06265 [Streptomyces sp. EAS-AB2608]